MIVSLAYVSEYEAVVSSFMGRVVRIVGAYMIS